MEGKVLRPDGLVIKPDILNCPKKYWEVFGSDVHN